MGTVIVLDKHNPIFTHSPGFRQLSAPAMAVPFDIALFPPTTSPLVCLEHNTKLAAGIFIINPPKKTTILRRRLIPQEQVPAGAGDGVQDLSQTGPF